MKTIAAAVNAIINAFREETFIDMPTGELRMRGIIESLRGTSDNPFDSEVARRMANG